MDKKSDKDYITTNEHNSIICKCHAKPEIHVHRIVWRGGYLRAFMLSGSHNI